MTLMFSSSNPKPTKPSLAVIIPAFNEEDTIQTVIHAVQVLGCEVVVVSDGSEDRTVERATATGATVVDLQPNGGKGAATFAGLQATDAEYILLLDADLLGLSREHLDLLLEPVLSGELDMTIGIFEKGGALTDFGNKVTPHLSGQRACKRQWMLEVPRLAEERWPEPAITDHLKKTKIRWNFITLRGLSQVMKEEKRGFWEGFKHRSKMYIDILGYKLRRDEEKTKSREP